MGDRAVYCARLESVCAERHPGFESPPIRHQIFVLFSTHSISKESRKEELASAQDLRRLSNFEHAVRREDAAKICSRINDAVAADNRAGIQNRVTTDLATVTNDRAKLP